MSEALQVAGASLCNTIGAAVLASVQNGKLGLSNAALWIGMPKMVVGSGSSAFNPIDQALYTEGAVVAGLYATSNIERVTVTAGGGAQALTPMRGAADVAIVGGAGGATAVLTLANGTEGVALEKKVRVTGGAGKRLRINFDGSRSAAWSNLYPTSDVSVAWTGTEWLPHPQVTDLDNVDTGRLDTRDVPLLCFTPSGVGIRAVNPAYSLHVEGDILATADVLAASDARGKDCIQPLADGALDALRAVRGVTYRTARDGRADMGVLAQDVVAVAPEAVREGPDGDLAVAYAQLVPWLIKAVQELDSQMRMGNEKQQTSDL